MNDIDGKRNSSSDDSSQRLPKFALYRTIKVHFERTMSKSYMISENGDGGAGALSPGRQMAAAAATLSGQSAPRLASQRSGRRFANRSAAPHAR